ncbi:hypothetical protein [Novosphingopyxis sp. YJ-S2-01]|uniref:hypothetical protein n=1 Tax=Novosphingopyxis sp. YJ-S2-01 TaxID=2794021 RepID=UPI0018DBB83E|nr:hypothetical protein [Novosphingopyxis sp. YJ-S2-01]MBH9537326.1 hypothetical protein [Novosphingopyxis sp. YJ-S2-01]
MRRRKPKTIVKTMRTSPPPIRRHLNDRTTALAAFLDRSADHRLSDPTTGSIRRHANRLDLTARRTVLN